MVFELTTANVKSVVLEAAKNPTLGNLQENQAYQKTIDDALLSTNPLVFAVVHINILEQLLNDVEHESVIDQDIYHAMELILRAINHLKLGSILEERRNNVIHHFEKIKNDRPLR